MDTVDAISLAAFALSGLSLFAHRLTRRKPRHDASDDFVGGDIAAVPRDFKVRHVRGGSVE